MSFVLHFVLGLAKTIGSFDWTTSEKTTDLDACVMGTFLWSA